MASTDGSGDYALPLADGTYHLWIYAGGFDDQWYPGLSAALFSDGWQLADPIDVDLRQDDREGWSTVARSGDPFADRSHEYPIEVCLSHRALAGRRRPSDHRKRTGLGISQETDERRQHL